MSIVTPTISPQYYSMGQTVDWVVAPNVISLTNVVNGIPPAISSYIAYDNLVPPTPFIAVTQDGKGNVVYDGGFPKFYNSRLADNTGSDFAGLTGAFKFLYNALNYTTNPAKSKRVLVLNDQVVTGSYSAKSTASNGFKDSLEYVATLAGFDIVIKDSDDWAGQIDIDLAELNVYSCMILMSTNSSDNFDVISQSAIMDIVAFRESGNGIIMVTDHGAELADIGEASQPHVGFFTFANRIAVNFGAYFTGDVDRSPVNIGFLRENYGDHPLYTNLLDSDDFLAGGSESIVVVNDVETFAPDTLPALTLDQPGRQTVSFLAVLDDGTVETIQYVFTITTGEFLGVRGENGIVSDEAIFSTTRARFVGELLITESDLGTLQGQVYKNNVLMGDFSATDTGVDYEWLSSYPTLNGNDVFRFDVTFPFNYVYETTVKTNNTNTPQRLSMAAIYSELDKYDLSTLPLKDKVKANQDYVNTITGTNRLFFTQAHLLSTLLTVDQ